YTDIRILTAASLCQYPLRIQAPEFGEGKSVLRVYEQPQAFNHTGSGKQVIRKGITELNILDPEKRSILQPERIGVVVVGIGEVPQQPRHRRIGVVRGPGLTRSP